MALPPMSSLARTRLAGAGTSKSTAILRFVIVETGGLKISRQRALEHRLVFRIEICT